MEKTPPIETTLYNGKIKVKFFPDSHQYWVDDGKDKWRPKSVTGICGIKDKSQALVPWALEEAAKHLIGCLEQKKKIDEEQIIKAVFSSQEYTEKAADLGTEVHDYCEKYIKNKISKKNPAPGIPEDENVLVGVNSFLAWESAHKVKFLWSEKLVYSKKHDYIGKADFAAIVDGKTCLCDIKTGNGLYEGVLTQTSAYLKADEEETGKIDGYDGRWAIRISKETEKEYHQRMAVKNKIKAILGKKEKEVEPYQIFQAVYLDEEKINLDEDFKTFLSEKVVSDWGGKKSGFFYKK
jgi:hypothetical protein